MVFALQRKTCGDYDPFKAGKQRVWCPGNTTFDVSKENEGPPSREL
jgi:hypothetical protein